MPDLAQSRLYAALLKVKRLTICPICAQRKKPGHCFDTSCYFALPPALRNLLYTPLDDCPGPFEDAYLQAMRHLHRKGMHRPYKAWPIEAQQMIIETGLIDALKADREERRRELSV